MTEENIDIKVEVPIIKNNIELVTTDKTNNSDVKLIRVSVNADAGGDVSSGLSVKPNLPQVQRLKQQQKLGLFLQQVAGGSGGGSATGELLSFNVYLMKLGLGFLQLYINKF